MTAFPVRRRSSAGFTLLEVVIALMILLVGILGLMGLQVIGMRANQGARAQTSAVQLARELAAGLEKLPWSDSRVAAAGGATAVPPVPFGRLLGTGAMSGYQTWSDASPVPGVRLDSEIQERDDDGTPTFKRRWTVWDYSDGTGRAAGGRLIAVSVIFHERATPIPYEVVYFASQGNASSVIANAGAFQ